MGVYAASTASLPMDCVYPGDRKKLWDAETPGSGGKSTQAALSPQRFGEGIKTFSIQLEFPVAPTSGEIDVEVADRDVDGDYVLLTGAVFTLGSATAYRGDFQTAGRFVRLRQVGALGTPGSLTAYISR